jgi:CRISPR-associated protein Csx14
MARSAIPVDLRNPGQVFACLGLAEAGETLLGTLIESIFRSDGRSTRAIFECSSAEGEPVREVVHFLRAASATAVIPESSDLSTKKWSVEHAERSDRFFPCSIPRTPATLPAQLSDGRRSITLSSWADTPRCGRDNVKFWAGAGGYPGAALARDILESIAALSDVDAERAVNDPFACSAPMSSSFRFDWRRDYIPLDAGFSPNKQSDVTMVGYPFTEVLAAIGLQHARPMRPMRSDKLRYRYGVWGEELPTVLARPVLGAVDIGVPMRTFEMKLGWPGQANQARCIIDAREEA